MALDKQSLPINFAKGLDTKTDPFQVMPGNFLQLSNSVFVVGGQLKKRNGFAELTTVPAAANATSIETWAGDLVALGQYFYSYNADSQAWQNKGLIQPVALNTLPLVRTSYTNSAIDVAVAPNGLTCIVFLDGDGAYKYKVADSVSGETVVAITVIPTAGLVPRVFVLGNYFIITYASTISPGVYHLVYIAIPLTSPTTPLAPALISTSLGNTIIGPAGYDGFVAGGNLYLAWGGADGGGAVRIAYLANNLVLSSTIVLAGFSPIQMSVTADTTGTTPIVWITEYDGTDAFTWAYTNVLNPIATVVAKHVITSETLTAITSTAQNSILSLFYDVHNTYTFASSVLTDFLNTRTLTQAGTLGSETTFIRSVGLGSKAFIYNGVNYMLAAYGGPQGVNTEEATYFLINGSGQAIARFAFENGGGYVATQVLPSVTLTGSIAQIGYLYRDLIQALSTTDVSSQAGFYSQTGVNMITLNLANTAQQTVEIGGTLCITGGFLWMYDGVAPVEQGFHLFPENIAATVTGSGGSISQQQYFYQAVYEWTDGNGNIHRSAPSIPVGANVTSGGGSASVTLNIPALRITYKTGTNAIRIVLYRWSTNQQTYYQITSVTAPLLNNITVDYVTYVDTLADSSIIGNNILYTTGGVIENIAGPACNDLALFDDRVWLIDAEDPNLLWFSKQVIEATPVEMSDLLTIYVAPSTGAQGSTGELTAIFPMDDKLILFKPDALAYVNGSGPDNTGANNQYSQPIFITSTIGSSNPVSIVFSPQGLFFDSDQGRWILGRDLSTNYVGAPVAAFNSISANGAVNVPEQNQIRMTLPQTTLVYNYFYNQWGTFTGIPSVSSTLYQGEHTFLNGSGQVFQESPGTYADGSEPVLMSFQTSWFNLTGLQGFERAYFFFLLGQYLSPHKLYLSIAYDYNPTPSQSILIQPYNYAPPYATVGDYGSTTPYAGPGNVEWWRVFFSQQKCTAFQITLQEVFDYSLATQPGAGFTLSGLNLIFGAKGNYPRLAASQSTS